MNSSPKINASANPFGSSWTLYCKDIPSFEPSPSNSSYNGVASGVDIIKIFNESMSEIIVKNEDIIDGKKYEQHLKEHFYTLNYFQKFVYLLFIDSKRRKEIISKKLRKK